MSEISKLEIMEQDQELFKKFIKAAKRGPYLNAAVWLLNNCIEVILFERDGFVAEHGRTGIATSVSFNTYNEEVLNNINTMLDCRAKDLKNEWKQTYIELESHMDTDYFCFGLDKKDYAVLCEGVDTRTIQYYRLPWSLNGVKKAAEYVANSFIPSLDEDIKNQRNAD